jgi:hypothetical protein
MHLLAIALVLLVVSFAIQAILVKTPKQKPPALEEWDFPQADDGTPQGVFFGDNWTDGPQILYHGNYRTKKIKAKGGK